MFLFNRFHKSIVDFIYLLTSGEIILSNQFEADVSQYDYKGKTGLNRHIQHNGWLPVFLTHRTSCKYNVITMVTTVISIGNSKGIRIPKPLLAESELGNEVELQVKKGEIRILAAPKKSRLVNSTLLLSEKTLATDWNRPEEDEAWASLQ